MQRRVWVYIAAMVVIQALCFVQVDGVAANGAIQGGAFAVSQRDMMRSGERVGLFQDIVRYIKAAQGPVVYVRPLLRSDSSWFGLTNKAFIQPLREIRLPEHSMIAPQTDNDAPLREASLRMGVIVSRWMTADLRLMQGRGPPVITQKAVRLMA